MCRPRQITTSVMIISAPVLLSSLFMMTNYSFIMTGLCVVGLGSYSIIFVSGLAAKLNILGTRRLPRAPRPNHDWFSRAC